MTPTFEREDHAAATSTAADSIDSEAPYQDSPTPHLTGADGVSLPPLFDLQLTDGGTKKISVIKEIRTHTGLSLRDAKTLAEQGGRVGVGLDSSQAEVYAARLTSVGATVQLVPSDGDAADLAQEAAAALDPRIKDPIFSRVRGSVQKSALGELRPDENILVVVRGAWGQAMIGTERRVIVCKPGIMAGAAFGSEMTSFLYRNLIGVQIHKGLMRGAVVLQSPGLSGYSTNAGRGRDDDPKKAPNAIPVDSQWDEVKAAVTRLQHLLDDAQRHPEPANAPAPDVARNVKSLTDELRELAELRNSGILDEDEFKTAKQRLLDRE